ncbi:MAG: iron donor protein CyaY [Myxococcales bacterium]|nr:iron donor protein CyaY [Myxococcales bacterium]
MTNNLSESAFCLLAEETLEKLMEVLSDLEDEGLEADLESGVLTLKFDDGARYVINSHRAALQIWMAADTTAWHFSWVNNSWTAQKTGEELWETVKHRVGAKLGRQLEL